MAEIARTEQSLPAGPRRSILRELIVFETKLAVDGLKDIVLAPLAIVATLWDMALNSSRERPKLTAVLRLGESFEAWLNLYGERPVAAANRTPFGQAGSDVLIDQIEDLARGAHDSISSSRREKRRIRDTEQGPDSDPKRDD